MERYCLRCGRRLASLPQPPGRMGYCANSRCSYFRLDQVGTRLPPPGGTPRGSAVERAEVPGKGREDHQRDDPS